MHRDWSAFRFKYVHVTHAFVGFEVDPKVSAGFGGSPRGDTTAIHFIFVVKIFSYTENVRKYFTRI